MFHYVVQNWFWVKFMIFLFFCWLNFRKLEDILDAFADRVSKPQLFLTYKMKIPLGYAACLSLWVAE